MIIPFDFEISLSEYAHRGKKNGFPVLDHCPNCHCPSNGNLYRNGFYWRNSITEELTVRIPICRLKCQICKVNISILPDFLIPYFQYTIHTILKSVKEVLENKKGNGCRQLWSFHSRRFMRSINWIHSFLVDKKEGVGIEKGKKEAINYMKMILDFGESPFLRRSWGHLSSYFMAN